MIQENKEGPIIAGNEYTFLMNSKIISLLYNLKIELVRMSVMGAEEAFFTVDCIVTHGLLNSEIVEFTYKIPSSIADCPFEYAGPFRLIAKTMLFSENSWTTWALSDSFYVVCKDLNDEIFAKWIEDKSSVDNLFENSNYAPIEYNNEPFYQHLLDDSYGDKYEL